MTAAGTTDSSPNEEQGDGGTNPRPQLSCTKCFDALWFCYCEFSFIVSLLPYHLLDLFNQEHEPAQEIGKKEKKKKTSSQILEKVPEGLVSSPS